MVKIEWTETARDDLKSIFEFIAKDSHFYATRFIDKIVKRVDVLEKYPNIGRIVPEFSRDELRELIEGNYRIIYQIHENKIEIIRIHHSARILE